MRLKTRVFCLGLAGVAALQGIALAADNKPNEVGVLIGATFGDKTLNDGDSRKVGPLGGLRYGHFSGEHWAFFADGTYSQLDTKLSDDKLKIWTLRVGPEYYFGAAAKKARWFFAPAAGWEWIDITNDKGSRGLISLGVGMRIAVGESSHFSWQVRADKTLGSSGADAEKVLNEQVLLGYAWGFGGPPKDTDGDGVPDKKDKCPNTPKGAKVDASGCPLDSDGDGVPDGADKCPNTPKGAKVDASGCPLDSDGDGVYDGLDKCPDTPKGWPVDANGCPIDSDGDGVPDGADKCPNTPKGTRVDKDGCPPQPAKAAPLFEGTRKTLVLEGVNFETDKAILLAESTAILDKVAASLRDWPEVKVEVDGYTDSTGPRDHNMRLSQARAESVKAYLAGKGVDASRLTTKGNGPDAPVADNTTAEGRAKNRRVELKKAD